MNFYKYKGITLVTDAMFYVIAVLFLIAVGVLGSSYFLEAGKNNKALADTGMLAAKISQYFYEVGKYPSSIDALKTAVNQYGPWLVGESPKDPWTQKEYQYSKDEAKGYVVFSVGKNKSSESSITNGIKGDDLGFRGR